MTGKIGPHLNPALGRVNRDRPAATGNGSPGPAPAHTPGQEAPPSLRSRPRPQPFTDKSRAGGAGPGTAQSGQSSGGSGASAMDEILGKLGGNWKEIQKDLGSHAEYEKACDRNPFIRAHLDPDIPSPRAGGAKDHWLQRPGFDITGGSASRQGGDRAGS